MAKQRKAPRPTQFGVISKWKGRTLVRVYSREAGNRRLLVAAIGSRKLVDTILKLGVDEQRPQIEMEAAIRKLSKSTWRIDRPHEAKVESWLRDVQAFDEAAK